MQLHGVVFNILLLKYNLVVDVDNAGNPVVYYMSIIDYLNNNDISKLGLRPSANFIKTQMCVTMSHGITLTLCKDDYIFIADKVLNELFHMNLLKCD